MRRFFQLTLARQLALIVVVAVAGIQVFILVLERRFQTAVDLDRGLGAARNVAANAVAVLPSLPPEVRQPVVRSYTSQTTQFFLLPELLVRPDAETVTSLEVETREWAMRRGLDVTDVIVVRHDYFRDGPPRGGVAPPSEANTGVPARLPTGFATGDAPRSRMVDRIGNPPPWLPIREGPNGYQLKPTQSSEVTESSKLRPIVTVALRLASTGEWLTFYRYHRPPPNNDTVAQMGLALAGSLLIAAVALVIGRRVIAPFRQLAANAIQLGRGERTEALPVSGPSDVRDVIRAFNRMNDQVSQSIDYQIGLLRSLGHDIKGPLASADRMLAELRPDSARKQIEERLHKVRKIVDAIMTFSRAIMRDGAAEPTDLVEILATLVSEQEENGEVAVLDAPERLLLPCRVDATERALRNLIENAIKYGHRANVRVFSEKDHAVVWVDDAGDGIPPEMLEAVFDPFLRLDDDASGSGLGLAISRTIAVDQGGSVYLENLPMGGLRAVLTLPIPRA